MLASCYTMPQDMSVNEPKPIQVGAYTCTYFTVHVAATTLTYLEYICASSYATVHPHWHSAAHNCGNGWQHVQC